MRKLLLVLIILTICFSSCSKKYDDSAEISSEMNLTKSLEYMDGKQVIAENTYYKVMFENANYYYEIYNRSGAVVDSRHLSHEPHICEVSNNLIKISAQTGTGGSTQWSYYYDVENDSCSKTFYGSLMSMMIK